MNQTVKRSTELIGESQADLAPLYTRQVQQTAGLISHAGDFEIQLLFSRMETELCSSSHQ